MDISTLQNLPDYFYFSMDMDYLSIHEKDGYRYVGMEKVMEISSRKFLYKQMASQNPESQSNYAKFKTQIKHLRQVKLPFRCIDTYQNGKKHNIYTKIHLMSEDLEDLLKTGNEQALLDKVKPVEKSVRLIEKIFWLHGSNSSLLAMLPYTNYTLIPSGELLNRGLAPMSGEISLGGLIPSGTNQRWISVDTIRNFPRCWGYATEISNSFEPELYEKTEELFLQSLEELKNMSPDSGKWDPLLVQLTRLKQWKPTEFSDLVQKYSEDIAEISKELSTKFCTEEAWILKALDYDKEKLKACTTSTEIRSQVLEDFINHNSIYNKSCSGFDDWYVFFNLTMTETVDLFTLPPKSSHKFNYFSHEWRAIVYHILHFRTHGIEGLKWYQSRANQTENPEAAMKKEIAWKENIEPVIQKDIHADIDEQDVELLSDILRKKIKRRIAKKNRPLQKRLDRMTQLFEIKPFVEFDEKAQQFIKFPFPLLLASTKTKSINKHNSSEFALTQAQFGKEMDLIFVLTENINQTQEWLKDNDLDHNVRVESFNQFELVNNLPLVHANFQISNLHPLINMENHQKLHSVIVQVAAPIYKSKYPDGRERVHHGSAHAGRVYLFANAIAEMYKEKELVSKKSPEHLLLAAFLHDCARENDGEDFWDKQSGEKCKEILIQHLKCSEEDADFFMRCIAEKDKKQPFSLDQKIIHDADCMEIVRCLYNPNHFIPDELWMLKDLNQEDVFQFIQESKELIALTETLMLKEFVAADENPVINLIQILEFANIHLHKFHLLSRCTNSIIHTFCNSTANKLTSEIEQQIINFFQDK